MTGVNVGFLPAGSYLGRQIAALEQSWVLIPIGMLMAGSSCRRSLPSMC